MAVVAAVGCWAVLETSGVVEALAAAVDLELGEQGLGHLGQVGWP